MNLQYFNAAWLCWIRKLTVPSASLLKTGSPHTSMPKAMRIQAPEFFGAFFWLVVETKKPGQSRVFPLLIHSEPKATRLTRLGKSSAASGTRGVVRPLRAVERSRLPAQPGAGKRDSFYVQSFP